jgi:hypothetical protein
MAETMRRSFFVRYTMLNVEEMVIAPPLGTGTVNVIGSDAPRQACLRIRPE